MKSITRLVLALITGSLFFASCSNDNKVGKLIPKDAALVVHVDGKSLSSKLTWEDIKKTSWFKHLLEDSSMTEIQKETLEDPAITGVDSKADMVMFLQMNASGPGQLFVEGTIKDTKVFEDHFKKKFPSAAVTKQNDVSFMTMKDDAVLGWKDDKFLYVVSQNFPGAGYNDMRMDTNLSLPAVGNSQRLLEAGKKIFALTADNSLSKDEKFSDLMKEEGDVHVYYNVEQVMNGAMGAPGMAGMLKLDKLITGTVSTYTVNFENGKIVVKNKLYVSKDLAAIFKKYDGGKIDENMIKAIPSDKIAGVVAMSFKPEGLQELVKLTGMDGLLNMALAQAGISFDDFIKANKGDLLLAVTNLQPKADSTTLTPGADTMPGYVKPRELDVLFSVSVGDKPSFEKLITAGKKMQEGKPSEVTYNSNDKYFAVSNNPDAVKTYLAGGNNKHAFWDRMSGHGFGMFADVQYILNTIRGTFSKDTTGRLVLEESLRMWEAFYSLGDGFSDGSMRSTTEITLMDKNTNSLKSLNAYMDRISAIFIADKRKWNQMTTPDSTRLSMDSIANP